VGPRGKRRPSSHADATEGFGDLSKNAFSRRRVVVGSLVRRVCGVSVVCAVVVDPVCGVVCALSG
jgi:hypothetical protein